jgi:nitroreductase
MDYESLLELVKARRSIRRFKPDPIPDEYVDKIIEVARWAPSGYNSQPWDFVVLKDKNIKDKIVKLCYETGIHIKEMEDTRESWQESRQARSGSKEGDFSAAPVFIILFGDTRTQEGLPMMIRYDKTERQVIYTSSLANAFLYMHLAATSLGLASQWVSRVSDPYVHCMLKDLLGIPGKLEIYDMMALGYPGFQPTPKLMRDKQKMVHYDRSGVEDFRTDAEVNDFIRKTRTWTGAMHDKKADQNV